MKQIYQYDVFISYRRDTGLDTARIICDRLKMKGYSVFMDIEELRSGAFNTQLYSVIDECIDFVVVLGPGALDRCVNEDDWLRLEVSRALLLRRNVIPVMTREFKMDAAVSLPPDIEKLRWQHGICASTDFFDAFIYKLVTMLHSKPISTSSDTSTVSAPDSSLGGAAKVLRGQAAKMEQLVTYLEERYRKKGHLVQILDVEENGVREKLFQARSQSQKTWIQNAKNLIGMGTAGTVQMKPSGDDLVYKVMGGRWLDKAVVGTVSVFCLWPLLLTASFGAWKQHQLLRELESDILLYFANK